MSSRPASLLVDFAPSWPRPDTFFAESSRLGLSPEQALRPFPCLPRGHCYSLTSQQAPRASSSALFLTDWNLRAGSGGHPVDCELPSFWRKLPSSNRGLGSPWALSFPPPALPSLNSGVVVEAERFPWYSKWPQGCTLPFSNPVFGPHRPAFHLFSFVKPFSDLSALQAHSQHSVRCVRGLSSPWRSLRQRQPSWPGRHRILSLVLGILESPPLS